MTPEQIKNMMVIAAANGDMKHYKKLQNKLIELEYKEQVNERI